MASGRVATPEEVALVRSRVAQGVPDRGSPIVQHLKQLKEVPPEVAAIDMASFPCSITTAGVITQPDSQTMPGNYLAELFQIRGYMKNPGTDPELLPLVTFNIRDRGRTGNLFTTPLEMAYLAGTTGANEGITFQRGMYVFQPGARISVDYTVDLTAATGYSANASEVKEFGVLLCFNLYAP